ncbi:MAG: divergent polysaccharide deacetylase family protein [Deltaproteobacteria bacterium]|nr:divergent polysaccharide deacetylase family protein [Deltaproteobacteria bacterium]
MKKKASLFLLLLLVILLGLAFSFNVYYFHFKTSAPVLPSHKERPFKSGERTRKKGEKSGSVETKRSRPRVAIIIDDLGYDPRLAAAFMRLDLPLTLSILPGTPFGSAIGREATEKGLEVLLHQPMEPADYAEKDPGPAALFVSMTEGDIIRVLNENLNMVPGAKGVNNHMGSRFTKDPEKMRVFMTALKHRGLFFIDSKTTKDSVAIEEAKRLGVKCQSRDVFLDNVLDPVAMQQQLNRLLRIAEKTGCAIGIGHPYVITLDMLRQNRESLKKGVHLVPVSTLVRYD